MWTRNIFYCVIATKVLSVVECVDQSPFCHQMAIGGACYSEDISVRSDMHEVCKNTCGTCSSTILSCDDGTETFNDKTNTTCCHQNVTNGTSEFVYSYTEFTAGALTYRNFSNYSGGCAVIPALIPFIFGPMWWYWLVVIAIVGILFGLFLAWVMFGQRDEAVDEMLEAIGQDSGRVYKKASKMTVQDIMTIIEHYNVVMAMSTFKARDFEDKDNVKPTPGEVPATPYAVLVAIFKSSNIDGLTSLDKADFNMAISTLGVSPTHLDIASVFDHLDDGSGKVTVDQLYERIKNNIATPESTEDIVTVLRAAVITTFVRERRASLSILDKFMAAHETPGALVSSESEDRDEQIEGHQTAGGLIDPEKVLKVIGQPEHLRSHEFNALLISMGVPFSENEIVERVLELEALQPEGIDGNEFKRMFEKDLKENPDALKSDVIIKVLDHLIARHGGEELAKTAIKTHHDKEIFLEQAAHNKSLSSDKMILRTLTGTARRASVINLGGERKYEIV
jgi:Ca2+-binding EF-hand superfamily protein